MRVSSWVKITCKCYMSGKKQKMQFILKIRGSGGKEYDHSVYK